MPRAIDIPTWEETTQAGGGAPAWPDEKPGWDDTFSSEDEAARAGMADIAFKQGTGREHPAPSLVAPVGKAMQKVGRAAGAVAGAYAFEAAGDPEDQAKQLGVSDPTLKKAGLLTEPSTPGVSPLEQGQQDLPLPARLLSKGAYGLVESAPQMAAVAGAQAVGVPAPVAAGVIFGITPEGFNARQAAVGALLPVVARYSGGASMKLAKSLNISQDVADDFLAHKLGGVAGATALIGADQTQRILSLPPEQRKAAMEDAIANVGSMAWLGLYGKGGPTKAQMDEYVERLPRVKTVEGTPGTETAETTPAQIVKPEPVVPPAPASEPTPTTPATPAEQNWRAGYSKTDDDHSKKDILRAIAGMKSTPEEQADVVERALTLPPGLAKEVLWDVSHNKTAGESVMAKAKSEHDRIDQSESEQTDAAPGIADMGEARANPELMTPEEWDMQRRHDGFTLMEAFSNAFGNKLPVNAATYDRLHEMDPKTFRHVSDFGYVRKGEHYVYDLGEAEPAPEPVANKGAETLAKPASVFPQVPEPTSFKSVEDVIAFRNKRLAEERELYQKEIGLSAEQAQKLQSLVSSDRSLQKFEKTLTPEQKQRYDAFWDGPYNQVSNPNSFKFWDTDKVFNPEELAGEKDPEVLAHGLVTAIQKGLDAKATNDRFLYAAIAANRLQEIGATKSDIARALDGYTTRNSGSQGDKTEFFRSLGAKINTFLQSQGVDLPQGDLGAKVGRVKEAKPLPNPEDKAERTDGTDVSGKPETPILSAGNVETSANVSAAQAAKPLGAGGFDTKAAREQKKFLLDATDQAIEQAPESLPETEDERDLKLVDYAMRNPSLVIQGRADAINALLEKYKIPTHQPPNSPTKEPVTIKQKDRLELLESAIRKAIYAAKPKVTIEVPGDGTFDVINSKPTLRDFKERAAKFPVTAPRAPGKPAARRETATPIGPVGKLTNETALKAAMLAVSDDETRPIIHNVWSDGEHTVATNGRMLVVIERGAGGTKKNPALFTAEGKPVKLGKDDQKYPNWPQMVPTEEQFKESVEKIDGEKFWTVLKQAEAATTEKSFSVVLVRNLDGTLGLYTGSDEASYKTNIGNGAVTIGAFDPKYLSIAVKAARMVGDTTLRLDLVDAKAAAPVRLKGAHSYSVIMPMNGVHSPVPEPEKDVQGPKAPTAGPTQGFGGGRAMAAPNAPSGPGGRGGQSGQAATVPVAQTPQELQSLMSRMMPGWMGALKDPLKLTPTLQSRAHLREAERLGSFLGPMHRAQESAAMQLKTAMRWFEKKGVDRKNVPLTRNAGVQFMSAMSTGAELPEPQGRFAAQIVQMFKQRLAQLEEAGVSLSTVRENYFPGMWTQESRRAFNAALAALVDRGMIAKDSDLNTVGADVKASVKALADEFIQKGEGSDKDMLAYLTRRPLAGKETFRKQKVFDDVMTAVEFGLRPVSNNPIDLVKLKLAEMDRSIMAHREFQSLRTVGKLKTISPYEQVPDGWVKVNDKYGIIYGAPTVTVAEWIDKEVYEGLERFAQSLGIGHERSMKFPPGKHSRALGLSYTGQNFVRTKFATETSVLAHEIGHQLDERYGLWDLVTGGERGNERKSAVQKELRAIADLVGERGSKAYTHSKPEKIAQMVEAYVHAPERMQQVAPTVFKKFDGFIRSKPELKPLAEIKPGIELKKLTGEKYVGLPIMGYRIVPQETGEILNTYLSSSFYNNGFFGKLYRGWMGLANSLNQSQLGWGSAFHAGFTTGEAQVSAGAQVVKDVYGLLRGNRSAKDLASTVGKWSVATGRTLAQGDKVLNAWRNPDGQMTPEIAGVVRAAELAGAGFKMERGLQVEQFDKLIRDWFSGEKLKAAMRSPLALMELLTKPIMNGLVPRQKAGVFAEMASRIIEQKPDKSLEELTPEFRQAWNRVDARLGQVRYDRLFINNTLKNVVQAVVRAPGWTGGTIAEIGGALPETGKFFHEWAKTGKIPENIPDQVAYVISLLLTVGLLNAILTYAFTGDSPKDLKDLFTFRDGTKDQYGRDNRFLLPTYAKDILAYYIHPATTLLNKLHPAASVIGDVARNRDYYGYEVRDSHADMFTQAGQSAEYAVKAFEPFWLRGAAQSHQENAKAASQVEALFGIMPAPSYVKETPMQRDISELYHKRTGEPIKPYGSQGKAKKQFDKATMDIYMFRHLPESDRKALAAKMTPEEKKRYGVQ